MNKYNSIPCVKWWTVLFSLKVARVSDHERVCVEQSCGTCCIYQWKRRTGFKLPQHSGWHSGLSLLPATVQLCVCVLCVCMCACGKRRCGCVVSQGWMLFLTRSGPDSERVVWVRLWVFSDWTWLHVNKVIKYEAQLNIRTNTGSIRHLTWQFT